MVPLTVYLLKTAKLIENICLGMWSLKMSSLSNIYKILLIAYVFITIASFKTVVKLFGE